jgi:hypothetical protein
VVISFTRKESPSRVPSGASRSANSTFLIIHIWASTRQTTPKPHHHKMAANVPTTVVDISSPDQFSGLLKSSKVVVTFCKLVPHLPLGLFSADCPSVARTNILQHMFLVLISSQSLRILLQDCYAHRFTQYLRSFPAFIRA